MDDKIVICPYDQSHKVLKHRLPGHLIKCSKNHTYLAICVYNATHRMPKDEMAHHLTVCETKKELMCNVNSRMREKESWTGGMMTKLDTRNEDKIVSNEYWD